MAALITLALTSCGGASTTTPPASTSAPATSTVPSAASTAPAASPVPVAAPAPVLRILLPAQGARTGAAVLVRVAVRRAPARLRLRYSVDHGRTHPVGLRFTLHELGAGRHRLVVTLLGDRAVHATVTFFVHPPPAPAPAPPPTAPTTSTATPTTTVAPPPPPTTTPPPNTIPQNNGGDGDADNNGAPSDGDGNF